MEMQRAINNKDISEENWRCYTSGYPDLLKRCSKYDNVILNKDR